MAFFTLESILIELIFWGVFRIYGLIPDTIVLIYVVEVLVKYKVSMELCLFFLTNFPGAICIQGALSIPDSRATQNKKIRKN